MPNIFAALGGGLLEGGAQGAAQAADSEMKFQQQQYLNQQLSDLQVQADARISENKMNMMHQEQQRVGGIFQKAADDYGPAPDTTGMGDEAAEKARAAWLEGRVEAVQSAGAKAGLAPEVTKGMADLYGSNTQFHQNAYGAYTFKPASGVVTPVKDYTADKLAIAAARGGARVTPEQRELNAQKGNQIVEAALDKMTAGQTFGKDSNGKDAPDVMYRTAVGDLGNQLRMAKYHDPATGVTDTAGLQAELYQLTRGMKQQALSSAAVLAGTSDPSDPKFVTAYQNALNGGVAGIVKTFKSPIDARGKRGAGPDPGRYVVPQPGGLLQAGVREASNEAPSAADAPTAPLRIGLPGILSAPGNSSNYDPSMGQSPEDLQQSSQIGQ
jgi:hypothetical protein